MQSGSVRFRFTAQGICMNETHQTHEFGPVYNADSKILILGSFPSVKSREVQFYYGHPQNRFWKLLARLYREEEPKDIPAKREFLLGKNIALWDVIESCDIAGSSDSSIKNAVPNDIGIILEHAQIENIYANGKTAERLCRKYIEPKTGRGVTGLPSTSPANAAFTMERLEQAWNVIVSGKG